MRDEIDRFARTTRSGGPFVPPEIVERTDVAARCGAGFIHRCTNAVDSGSASRSSMTGDARRRCIASWPCTSDNRGHGDQCLPVHRCSVPQPLAIGRIRGLSVSDSQVRREVGCLLEKFFGSSCFNPGSEADDGFGVFAKPVGGVAFDTQVRFSPSALSEEPSTHGAFDRAAADRQMAAQTSAPAM